MPASMATSSRRSPPPRLRSLSGKPTSAGLSNSRRARREAASPRDVSIDQWYGLVWGTGGPSNYQQRRGLDTRVWAGDADRIISSSMKETAMSTRTYGPTTTAAEIVRGVDLNGRRAVVTGASSGIGVETARALASSGAEVTLAVRNVDAGRKVADGIAAQLPSDAGTLQVAQLDLADAASVAGFVRA